LTITGPCKQVSYKRLFCPALKGFHGWYFTHFETFIRSSLRPYLGVHSNTVVNSLCPAQWPH